MDRGRVGVKDISGGGQCPQDKGWERLEHMGGIVGLPCGLEGGDGARSTCWVLLLEGLVGVELTHSLMPPLRARFCLMC